MYKFLIIFFILGCAAENGGQFTNSDTVTATQTNTSTLSAHIGPSIVPVVSQTVPNTETGTVIADARVEVQSNSQTVIDTQTLTSAYIVDAGTLIYLDSGNSDTTMTNLNNCLLPIAQQDFVHNQTTDIIPNVCADVLPLPSRFTYDTSNGDGCGRISQQGLCGGFIKTCGYCKTSCNTCRPS